MHFVLRTIQSFYQRKNNPIQVHQARLFKERAAKLNRPIIFIIGTHFLYGQFNNDVCLSGERGVLVGSYCSYCRICLSCQSGNITGNVCAARTAAGYQQISLSIFGVVASPTQ